jgi:molybdenum cofactor guanylyltransferase
VHHDLACAVIAGGAAVRFGGRVKPLVEVGGRRILDRQLEVLTALSSEILIAANDPAPFAATGLPVVPDRITGAGPLAGIHAALLATGRPWLLAVAGDMPFLSSAVIERLLRCRDDAAGRGRVDAVAPLVDGFPQALHAVYGAGCAAIIERRLGAGQSKAHALFADPDLAPVFVTEAALRADDPALAFLRDVDSPQDLS